MSDSGEDRSARCQSIQEGLNFIQSTLPFPGSQEMYETFLQDLVKNLFKEGCHFYSECDWARSVDMYTEALNIADYAESEEIQISIGITEKLYANRAAIYLKLGLSNQALEDCEKALELNEGNHRALYRKARSLRELGRHQEAYEAVAKCSLAVPQDASVAKLTQELAKMLGLKVRKAYVRSQPALSVPGPISSVAADDKPSNGPGSVEDIELLSQEISSVQSCPFVMEPLSVPVTSMSLVAPIAVPYHKPTASPLSTSDNGEGRNSHRMLDSHLNDNDIIDDELDDLLDNMSPTVSAVAVSTVEPPIMPSAHSISSTLFAPIPTNPIFASGALGNLPVGFPYFNPVSPFPVLEPFPSGLDSLDCLSISDTQTDYSQQQVIPASGVDMNQLPAPVGQPQTSQLDLAKNPLADTHEFKLACSVCYIRSGPGILDYALGTEEHKCKKDLLLGRLTQTPNPMWKLIRPRPTRTHYAGPYYICRDVQEGGECRYPGHCTFAYCQEEIDVWSLERKGLICRELLCDPQGGKLDLSLSKILLEHQGVFMFLCEVCFDHKPRIISKTSKDDPSLCSHPVTRHSFSERKCLVHVVSNTTVRYTKIRPYNCYAYQMDLCRHEVRYGCVREDSCFFAHSFIELKVWMLQHEQGISHESIVQESAKNWNMTTGSLGVMPVAISQRKFGPANLKLQFVCAQCWTNGQVSEPDKNKKYCVAKARHLWTKDKRVVLVSSSERKKWTTVRPLPTKKPIPSQFEICNHIASGKKCQFIGNCSFAHSTEERDLWTFLKDHNIMDMEQLYERWLQSQKPDWNKEMYSSARENGKPIQMPTDYAEEVAGNHCWLCGKNCNSEKQWQQHITSEKHKEKVFNSEDDQNCWQYRFPTGTFKVCERFLKGTCTEEENCKLAHGEEELMEWKERSAFLLQKLAKARKDHLLAPDDNDFGKYSFLLKAIK